MPTKNLFISHIHEDDAHVEGLKKLLAGKGYDVRNGSITLDKFNKAKSEDYIKRGILAPRINWAGCLVVLVSTETKASDFVNWEIEYASNHDTRVVAVFEPGETGVELPEAAEDYADAVVSWNGIGSSMPSRARTNGSSQTAALGQLRTRYATTARRNFDQGPLVRCRP